MTDGPGSLPPRREPGLAGARSSAARQAAARSQPRRMDSPPPHGWGAAAGCAPHPVCALLRGLAPTTPLPAATGSPITGTRCGLGAGVPSQRLQGRRALTLGRSADCGAPGVQYRGRRGEPLWSPRERTPQVEPAAHQVSVHSRSRRSLHFVQGRLLAELGMTMAGRSRPMTYDLRLTTTCFT